jgi:hypothetical protein
LVRIEKIDTGREPDSMVAKNTGAAGIAEAGSRFGDEGPRVGRVSGSAANLGLVIIAAATALVLAWGRNAQGREAPDGGTRAASSGVDGPPGAFLGPLPVADPEKLYPLKPGPNGSLRYEAPQFSALVAADGTVTFRDQRIDYSARRSTLSFDLSDEFVRELAHGTSSPYAKANFLAATFKRRTAMAAEVNSRQMRAARIELPRQLDALWADTRYRRRERRRIVFLMWKELDRSVADGRSAATTIEAWIRKRLPRGSSDAYTDQELATYSRERPAEPAFSPYGSPLEMRWPSP